MEIQESNRKIKKPRGCKRNVDQQDHDIAFCSNLFLRGYTYREIAAALNAENARIGVNYTITHQMVCYDIHKQLIQWKKERMDNIDDYITQELRKLDRIEMELWDAWNISKRGITKTKVRKSDIPKKRGRPKKNIDYSENTCETSSGNPRFLDLLLNVQQRRAKMLGFDAPIKIDLPSINNNSNNDEPKYNIDAIPDELLFEVADKLQSAEYQKALNDKGQNG